MDTFVIEDVDQLRAEIDRLRAKNHAAAVRRDRETAEMTAQLAQWKSRVDRARELVRGSPVDWTDTPGSHEPDGWWKYTSQQNRDILIAAVHDAQRDCGTGR